MNACSFTVNSYLLAYLRLSAEFGQLLQKSGISLTESMFIFLIQAVVHANTIEIRVISCLATR